MTKLKVLLQLMHATTDSFQQVGPCTKQGNHRRYVYLQQPHAMNNTYHKGLESRTPS